MPTSQVSLQDRMSRETQLPLGQEPHKKPEGIKMAKMHPYVELLKSNYIIIINPTYMNIVPCNMQYIQY